MEERQSLETLRRDLKICSRTLTQFKEKAEAFEQKRDKLTQDEAEAKDKKNEVSSPGAFYFLLLNPWDS